VEPTIAGGRAEGARAPRRRLVIAALGAGLWLALSRLPQIYGPNGFLDGDESILALMALHLTQGRPALFFYGQSFGLAIFESAAVAVAFTLFGVATAPVKWAMLAVWAGGVAGFTHAMHRALGPRAALIGLVLSVTCPAFGAWSTLARGYHVAAFTLMQLALWQIVRLEALPRPARGAAALAGVTTGLVAMTNAIWMLALLPFAVVSGVRRREPAEARAFASGALLAVVAAVGGAALEASSFWSPGFLRGPEFARSLGLLPARLAVAFSGAYAYGSPTEAGIAASLAGWVWTSAVGVVLARGAWLLWKRGAADPRLAALASVALILLLTLAIAPPTFGYRYLLPVVPGLVWLVGVEFREAARGRPVVAWLAVLLLAASGAAALVEAPPRWAFLSLTAEALDEDDALVDLVRDLEASGVHHVYSLHPLLQWNVLFYSRERVLARFTDPADRIPAYPRAVDTALGAGKPVALVGTARQWPTVRPFLASSGIDSREVRVAGGRYFWVPGVPREVLERMGFRFAVEGTDSKKRPVTLGGGR
jgi:hypothetical protein